MARTATRVGLNPVRSQGGHTAASSGCGACELGAVALQAPWQGGCPRHHQGPMRGLLRPGEGRAVARPVCCPGSPGTGFSSSEGQGSW